VRPRGQGSYTNKELADAVQDRGTSCTPQYIGQLRAGRHAPSLEMAAAIAGVFGVPTDYFSNPDTASRTDDQLAFLASLRDTRVTAVALRAADLSDQGLATLSTVIDEIRAAEGLPPA
jgi:transcriptional regulator with XRE-family HTH domain